MQPKNISTEVQGDGLSKATQPIVPGKGGKRKSDATDPGTKKKKRETSDKSLQMGLFHVKNGTPVAKGLPDKSKLKDGEGICMDFCARKRKWNFTRQICKNGKNYTNWKNVHDKDKLVLCHTWIAPAYCGLRKRP